MKKYKLKEEAKRFLTNKLNVQIGEVIQTLEDWEKVNFCIEALEEVDERIEIIQLQCTDAKYVTEQILNDRVNLCEKALNRELITLKNARDFIMDMIKRGELDWGVKTTRNVTLESQITEYLNEKK